MKWKQWGVLFMLHEDNMQSVKQPAEKKNNRRKTPAAFVGKKTPLPF